MGICRGLWAVVSSAMMFISNLLSLIKFNALTQGALGTLLGYYHG